MTDVIAKDIAEQTFGEWAEAMDLDVDPAHMDEEDVRAFERQKNRIMQAFMCGDLTLNDNSEAVYTPSHPSTKHKEPITFRERTGASLMATDQHKQGRSVAKMYAMLADMTGVHQKAFAGMVGRDIKLVEALFALLMD